MNINPDDTKNNVTDLDPTTASDEIFLKFHQGQKLPSTLA